MRSAFLLRSVLDRHQVQARRQVNLSRLLLRLVRA
jgi:hypothetical protein